MKIEISQAVKDDIKKQVIAALSWKADIMDLEIVDVTFTVAMKLSALFDTEVKEVKQVYAETKTTG